MKNHQHDCVYYFENEQQIKEATISFKTTFQIKLSKAQKILSSSLGCHSYNELLEHIKEHKRIGERSESFIKKLTKTLATTHKVEIDQKQIDDVEKYSTPLNDFLKKTTFEGYYQHALASTGQRIPMHGARNDNSPGGHSYNGYERLNPQLHHYLVTGEITDEFKRAIKVMLKESRAKIKQNGVFDIKSYGGERYFDVARTLEKFKQTVLLYSDPCPVFYYSCFAAILRDADGFNPLSYETMFARIKTGPIARGRHDDIIIGDAVTPISSLLNYDVDDMTANYKHTFSSLFCSVENEKHQIYASPELNEALGASDIADNQQSQYILDVPESDGCYLTLHKERCSLPLEYCIADGFEDEEMDQIIVGAIPVIKTGSPLKKNEQLTIQQGLEKLWEEDEGEEDFESLKGRWYLSSMFNLNAMLKELSNKGTPKLMSTHVGEIIGKILKDHPGAKVEISDMTNEIYTTIDAQEIKNPYGFDGAGMQTRFFVYETSCKGCPASDQLENIAIAAGKVLKTEIAILDTYTNNLERYEDLCFSEDGAGYYSREFVDGTPSWVKEIGLDADGFEVVGEGLKYFSYEDGFESQLPFDQCHHVYIITQDNGDCDDRHFIAGYNRAGECMINGVYTPFRVNQYCNEDWVRYRKTLKHINNKITGSIYKYDCETVDFEGENRFCYGTQAEGLMLLNQNEFVRKYFLIDPDTPVSGSVDSLSDSRGKHVKLTISIKRQNKTFITDIVEIEDVLEQCGGFMLSREKSIHEQNYTPFGMPEHKSQIGKKKREKIEYCHHIEPTSIDHVFHALTQVIDCEELLIEKQKQPITIKNKEYMLYVQVVKGA